MGRRDGNGAHDATQGGETLRGHREKTAVGNTSTKVQAEEVAVLSPWDRSTMEYRSLPSKNAPRLDAIDQEIQLVPVVQWASFDSICLLDVFLPMCWTDSKLFEL